MYETKGKVWVYRADAGGSWHFLHVDKKTSEMIKKNKKIHIRFGSVRVKATLGKTSWETSLFPSSKDGVYLLPLKALVRKKEGVFEGDTVRINLQIL
jgi:hypothetical protein